MAEAMSVGIIISYPLTMAEAMGYDHINYSWLKPWAWG